MRKSPSVKLPSILMHRMDRGNREKNKSRLVLREDAERRLKKLCVFVMSMLMFALMASLVLCDVLNNCLRFNVCKSMKILR